MSKNYTVMELEAIKHLCKCVNSVANLPADLIADTNVATNTTYSSYKIDAEMSALENDIQRYVDTALAGLNKLSKEIIDDKALVVKENVLYLYKDPLGTSNDYMQMMLINGVAVELGSTSIDMSGYYTNTEIDAKFALKIDLDVLTTSFNDLVTSVEKKIDKDKIVTVLDDTVTDEQVASALLTKTELDKTNANLGEKADRTELNKRREIRVGEIYDSNGYYRVDAIGYYARPLYFRVVSTNGGEEILSFGQSVTSERKVIGKSVNTTFKYTPPTENASNGTLFIKANRADISLTIFYTQIYSVASIPTLRDSTAEEYATGTDFNVQELATKTYVTDKINEVKDNVDNHTHSYNDLNDKPTIPTKVSELENDRGYLTSIPKEYITESELKTKVLRVFYDEREINEAHGTNISLVVGEDNTEKIINALEPHEEFINWFGNTTLTDRFGIDESMGIRLNVVSIQKCTNNEGFAYAITNKGKLLSRFFQDGVLSKWDYDSTNLTEMNTKISQLETQVSDLFQSVSDGKTLVANAITDKGVSTATNATFATMASNISNITTTYKEETKSYNNTSSGTTRLVFTFSANVSGVKQITPPSNISPYIVPETATNMFTINGKELILYVNGVGTWEVTAFIKQ